MWANATQDIIAHMASSSEGFFDGQQYHLDLVRLGTAMYGSEWNTTAARWLTRITGIKQVYRHRHPCITCPDGPQEPEQAHTLKVLPVLRQAASSVMWLMRKGDARSDACAMCRLTLGISWGIRRSQ